MKDNKRIHYKVLLLIEFYNIFNRWPKQREKYKDVNIGTFLSRIKNKYLYISDDDLILLKNIGFKFNTLSRKELVHNKVLLLIEFYNKFNRWPKRTEKYKNVNIGGFCNNIRTKETSISTDDTALLQYLNFNFNNTLQKEKVHNKVLLLVKFYNKYNSWPKRKDVFKNVNIGVFCNNIRSKNISISEEDTTLLKNLGFNFNTNSKSEQVHNKVLLLVEFYNKYNSWPKRKDVFKNVNIGVFCNNIRSKETSISADDTALLKYLNFNFNNTLKKEKVHNKVLLLIEFYNKFNRWPKTKETYKGVNIGAFARRIKSDENSISSNDFELLKKLGFKFN